MIDIENLTVTSGTFRLDGATFQVPDGAYCVLMGRTGSGKTTLIEALCGLRPVSAGRIRLGDLDVTRLKAAERGIGYVPQDGALFYTMTVRDHLQFALRIRRWSSAEIRERVDELASLLGIAPLLERTPHGLSGGEKQRVALGRALSFRPRFLCLDEPLSALDDETREEMCRLLKRAQQETRVTVLHVTHSRTEADRLADLVLELVDGRVVNRSRPATAADASIMASGEGAP